jgi:hypothetical protein
MKNLLVRIQLVVHQLNLARRLRLLPRKRYPGLTVVPLHRGLLSRLVGILGFGE